MKKKLIAIPLLAAGLLAGCVSSSPEGDGTVTVKFSMMNSANENDGWGAQIDKANELMAQDGVKVQIAKEVIKTDSWDEYYTKVASNLAGRTGGTIGRIAESHIPNMVKKNQLQDLTEIVTELKGTGEYNNEAFEGVAKKDDSYYGIPSGTQHMVLYYNKDIIDNYNRNHAGDPIGYPSSDWDHPSTFAEIKDMALKLSSGTGQTRSFGLSAGPFLAYAGMYAMNSGGENIFNSEGQPVINTQPFYDVYDWFDAMLKVDKSMPTTSDTQVSTAINRFLSGNIAMMIDGIWQMHEIVEYTEFNVGVAAIPVKIADTPAKTTTFKDCFFAVRTSSHQDADKTALKYIMKAQSINALAEKSVGGYPIHNGAVDTYNATLADTKVGSYVQTIAKGRERAVPVPYSTYYNVVDQRINQKMSLWIAGDMTAHEFVDYMQDTMVKGMNGLL